ncbi:MAG: SDR family NAD(P)-dependent oxidoreductase [Dechloromonas sp.]|jgi:NAD(P)-dependent dehydrogenase (short-subunit alcohol dehydrogenase family)|nr:SDR family NAD(P)-dependent oxidoreductase [Dechloromonas sp.]
MPETFNTRKQVAVIGGTAGIGRAIALHLAELGANVLVVGRTFRDADHRSIRFIHADLSLMREARRVGGFLSAEPLDLIVMTTGIMPPPQRQETAEGLEMELAVSYLCRHVILHSLAPRLGANRTPGQRRPYVFVMGFPGSGQMAVLGDLNSEQSYQPMRTHMSTVAGNEMLVLDAARRYPQAAFFGLNPGIIRTEIRDNFLGKGSWKSRVIESLIGLVTPSPEDYAARIAPLLFDPQIDDLSGSMFNRKGKLIPASRALTPQYTERFMAEAGRLVDKALQDEATDPGASRCPTP